MLSCESILVTYHNQVVLMLRFLVAKVKPFNFLCYCKSKTMHHAISVLLLLQSRLGILPFCLQGEKLHIVYLNTYKWNKLFVTYHLLQIIMLSSSGFKCFLLFDETFIISVHALIAIGRYPEWWHPSGGTEERWFYFMKVFNKC